MKHKSGWNLAVTLLRALLLMVPVSAFSATEADQEIGIPQPMETRAKGCFGVVLSPDGDGFYSVRDGLITHYQIDPFKKTASVTIDETQLKDIPEKTECRVLIMDDVSKLILVFPEWIVLLDTRTGKISKKLERQGALRSERSKASTLNGNDLVILGRAEVFQFTVFDARTLQMKTQISDLKERFGFMSSNDSAPYITKIENRLYLSSGRSLVVLNGKTYEPELALTTRAGQVGGIKISKDYRKLYVASVSSVRDYLTQTEKNSAGSLEDSDVVFDQETRQISFEEINFDKAWLMRDKFDPLLFTRNPSRNRDFVSYSQRERAGISSRNANISYIFYQYESGEAILKMTQYPDRKFFFQLTPGARQYLMMKDHTEKLVPINDITFNKYLQMESRR